MANDAKRDTDSTGTDPFLIWIGLGLIMLASLGPLLGQRLPANFVQPFGNELVRIGCQTLACGLLLGIILAQATLEQRVDRGALGRAAILLLLSSILTATHYFIVDRQVPGLHPVENVRSWQEGNYLAVLNHTSETPITSYVPHVYRPLPYGFVRGLEYLMGGWVPARLAYWVFFTYWLLWAMDRFARLFLPAGGAAVVVIVYALLYPLSIWYYIGQPTDPMSHALFVLALVLVVEDRWPALALTLALGVMAKETAMIIVFAYLACNARRGAGAWARTMVLAAVCVAAFLATRLPLGWRLSYRSINSTMELMVKSNLGLNRNYSSIAPIWQNYLQPFLFVGIWLAPLAWKWRWIDPRLKAMALTLVPILLGTNLCFGWLHESRNYVPLLPLLVTMALVPRPSSNLEPMVTGIPVTAPSPLAPG
jgi:hypothetical protein